jgi:hypothetical protein
MSHTVFVQMLTQRDCVVVEGCQDCGQFGCLLVYYHFFEVGNNLDISLVSPLWIEAKFKSEEEHS